jgi:Flp pilus assembly protein TadD
MVASARLRRHARALIFTIAAAALTAGCASRDPAATGSIPANAGSTPGKTAELTLAWAKRYNADPSDRTAALNYAAALDAIDQKDKALAVLEAAAQAHPNDPAMLSAFGRALAKAGRNEQALAVLTQALQPDHPDLEVLNAQGAVLDRMGKSSEAERVYLTALHVKPNDPTTLSNLGLSYALAKNLPKAEATLRRAVAQPGATARMRQNLALVLALQHKYAEAEKISAEDLPPAQAAANVRYWRERLDSSAAAHGKG